MGWACVCVCVGEWKEKKKWEKESKKERKEGIFFQFRLFGVNCLLDMHCFLFLWDRHTLPPSSPKTQHSLP